MSGILGKNMSRIAKKVIDIPDKVDVDISVNKFSTKGALGELTVNIPNGYKITKKEQILSVEALDNDHEQNPIWGTVRALVANAIKGVSVGFSKTLELNGTGYRASVTGNVLKLQLGFSHDINYDIPNGVKIVCPKQNIIKLSSFNKELLGKTAAEIRSYRKPEPFKGKGIKYENEYIFRKEGKKK